MVTLSLKNKQTNKQNKKQLWVGTYIWKIVRIVGLTEISQRKTKQQC